MKIVFATALSGSFIFVSKDEKTKAYWYGIRTATKGQSSGSFETLVLHYKTKDLSCYL